MEKAVSPEAILSEHYEITQVIDRGAAIFTALGRDRVTDEAVFMKARENDEAGQAALRTRNEANHYASLDHPQIPGLVEARPSGDYPYLVTTRMPGNHDPELWLRDNTDHELAAIICLSALEVLQYVHEQDVVHRDVKEDNLVMQWADEGETGLVDFELALNGQQRAARRDQSKEALSLPADVNITSPDKLAGTATHVSPEQLRGEEATFRSDIYSMGIVMYVLTHGKLPFDGRSPDLLRHRLENNINFEPEGRRAPDALRLIMERATQTDPADRYPTADEMAEDVQRYLYAQSVMTSEAVSIPA